MLSVVAGSCSASSASTAASIRTHSGSVDPSSVWRSVVVVLVMMVLLWISRRLWQYGIDSGECPRISPLGSNARAHLRVSMDSPLLTGGPDDDLCHDVARYRAPHLAHTAICRASFSAAGPIQLVRTTSSCSQRPRSAISASTAAAIAAVNGTS